MSLVAKFKVDDYVKLYSVPGTDNGRLREGRYAQVTRVYEDDGRQIRYEVITIDNFEQAMIRDLWTWQLRPAGLNAMEILALQADPNFSSEG